MLQQLIKAAQPGLLTLVPQLTSTTDSSSSSISTNANKADSDSDNDSDMDVYSSSTSSKTAAAVTAAVSTAAITAAAAVSAKEQCATSEDDVSRWLEAGLLKRSQSAVALMWLTEVADKVLPEEPR
jgi:hypothetical protein